MPSASGSSTGRRQSGARSSCPRRTTISMNYSVTWPRRPTTRATGDGDSAWMPPTTKLSNVLRNPVQLRTRGEGAFRRPRWPVFSDLHPSGAATARRAAESGGRSGSALVRRARPRSCPPPGAGRMRACGAPSHDRRTPRTLAGRDWTGLDWTGLDWTGLDWTGLDWTGLDWTGRASPSPGCGTSRGRRPGRCIGATATSGSTSTTGCRRPRTSTICW
jgi:hypothetical protein